jgi:hypothetical protein
VNQGPPAAQLLFRLHIHTTMEPWNEHGSFIFFYDIFDFFPLAFQFPAHEAC